MKRMQLANLEIRIDKSTMPITSKVKKILGVEEIGVPVSVLGAPSLRSLVQLHSWVYSISPKQHLTPCADLCEDRIAFEY